MIKAVFHPFWGAGVNEDILGYPHSWVGDRYAQPLRELKAAAARHGIEMAGTGFTDYKDADVFFFWERPREGDKVFQYALASGKPMYLLATEPVSTLPMNGSPDNIMLFDKIFVWNGKTGHRVFHIKPIYFAFPRELSEKPFASRKLSCMIASIYNRENDADELYSKRAESVRWFEQNHPDGMDFYGRQNRFTDTRFSIYRGPVDNKLPLMEQYKFIICYENTCGLHGYISEKIFDAFFAGCVPVYWGAPDVSDYIPADCYIDRREFDSYEKLYDRLISMDENEYTRYRERAASFLTTPFARGYDEFALAKTILDKCFNITM